MNEKKTKVGIIYEKTTTQRWGDGWNETAGTPIEDHAVTISVIDPHGRASQILGRFFATKECGYIDDVGTHLSRGTISLHDTDPLKAIESAKAYADEIRAGKYDPPTVSLEQAREFSRLGIALRTDGIFGYKRKCALESCNETYEEECFGDLDPAKAIEGAKERSGIFHTYECGLEDGGIEDEVGQHLLETMKKGDRQHMLSIGALIKNEDDEDELASDWWKKAKLDERAKSIVVAAASECAENWDHDGSEGAIDCLL